MYIRGLIIHYKSEKHILTAFNPLPVVFKNITRDDTSSILGVQSIGNLRKGFFTIQL